MENENYTVDQLVEKFNTIALELVVMHRGFSVFENTTFSEFRNYFNMHGNLDTIAEQSTINDALELCFDLVKEQFENDKYNQIGKINCWFD